MRRIYFVSGHRDLTQEEFDKYYAPKIDSLLSIWPDYASEAPRFVVGDYYGCDIMAQEYIKKKVEKKTPWWFSSETLTVYHMLGKPRNYIGEIKNSIDDSIITVKTVGGFKTDEDRDAAMTMASDYDIAFVREGKRDSGTAQNIVRRYEFKK